MNKRIGGWLFLFLGVAAIGGGIWLSYAIGAPMVKTAKASLTWPITPGTIKTSKVESNIATSGDGNTRTEYRPIVDYSYSMNGQAYHSNNLWFGGGESSTNRSESQDIIDRYPVGKQVMVHYDPQDPSQGVLEPGVFASTYTALVGGWVVVGLGFILLWAGWTMFKIARQERQLQTPAA
jgi:hypothetical protein